MLCVTDAVTVRKALSVDFPCTDDAATGKKFS
jgi:hypothetical protein